MSADPVRWALLGLLILALYVARALVIRATRQGRVRPGPAGALYGALWALIPAAAVVIGVLEAHPAVWLLVASGAVVFPLMGWWIFGSLLTSRLAAGEAEGTNEEQR